jgi:hypothetical protein
MLTRNSTYLTRNSAPLPQIPFFSQAQIDQPKNNHDHFSKPSTLSSSNTSRRPNSAVVKCFLSGFSSDFSSHTVRRREGATTQQHLGEANRTPRGVSRILRRRQLALSKVHPVEKSRRLETREIEEILVVYKA